MLDDYRALAIFATVAEAGSFTAAGKRLKLSTSVVSHHISKLEERLGVTLFFRTTRALSLSPEGELVLGAARRMVDAGDEALDALDTPHRTLNGMLRISVPGFDGGHGFIDAVLSFAFRHPGVSLTLHSSDLQMDLVRQGFDLAIRLGRMSDSTMKSRRIGSFQRVLAASPRYLANHPPIRNPEDLARCEFIRYAMLPNFVTLSHQDDELKVPVTNSRIEVDSIASARAAAVAGLGLATLPRAQVASDIEAGTLTEVLPDWPMPMMGVYAVWPGTGQQKLLTRRLVEFLGKNAD